MSSSPWPAGPRQAPSSDSPEAALTAGVIDSHCHLEFPDFAADTEETVARARRAGVSAMVTIGTYLSRTAPVLALGERFTDVWCTVGVHPHNAEGELAGLSVTRLAELGQHPKVVGLGETGLDYFYEHSARDAQQESFRRHIRASLETGLPLIVHTRDADDDTLRLLEEERAGAPLSGIFHCFSGNDRLAEAALGLGFHLSISGIITFKKADALRQTVARVPVDRLLVETDSPYLAPIPHRGRRNEPAYVVHTAVALAGLLGMAPAALAAATSANFRRLFRRAESGNEAGIETGSGTEAGTGTGKAQTS